VWFAKGVLDRPDFMGTWRVIPIIGMYFVGLETFYEWKNMGACTDYLTVDW